MRSKADGAVRSKVEWLEDGAMEEDDGFGVWIGGVAEVIDVAVGTEALDDL